MPYLSIPDFSEAVNKDEDEVRRLITDEGLPVLSISEDGCSLGFVVDEDEGREWIETYESEDDDEDEDAAE